MDKDPYGIADVFTARLVSNLELMHPEMAAREAMAAVDAYLKASKFVDMSAKGEAKHYIRFDRRPEEMMGRRG
jgi:hypothetical protein